MVWFVGFIGFLLGFSFGQVIMMRALKDKTDEELRHDKKLQRKWGLFCWGLSIAGAWIAVYVFNNWEALGLAGMFQPPE